MGSTLENLFSTNFQDESNCDIILKIGQVKFPAHRMVLYCWSTYFQKFLGQQGLNSSNMTNEKYNGSAPTMDLSDEISGNNHFESFLEFLYSGQITLEKLNIWKIVELATKFEVPELRKVCSDFLMDLSDKSATEKELLENMVLCKRWSMEGGYTGFKERLQYLNRADMPPCMMATDKFTSLFRDSFNNQATSDVSLIVGDETFHVHLLILSSRCDKFMELLYPSKESCVPIAITKDIIGESEDIFKQVLKFLYTDEIEINFETVWQVASIARKLKEHRLLQLCVQFVIENAWLVPINDDLVHCLHQAEMLDLSEVSALFFQIILANFSFFSEDLLPAINIELLCRVLEQSDLVVDNEFALYTLIQPKLAEVQENGDSKSLHKILDMIRFDQMTAVQLKRLVQQNEEYFSDREEYVDTCLNFISSKWEKQESFDESDLALTNTYTFYDLVEPRYAEFREYENYSYHGDSHELKVVRFDEITARHLKSLLHQHENTFSNQTEYSDVCLAYLYSIWEQKINNEKTFKRGGPRKYLNEPQPHFPVDKGLPYDGINTHFKIDKVVTGQHKIFGYASHQGNQTGENKFNLCCIPVSTKFQSGTQKYDTLRLTITFQKKSSGEKDKLFPLLCTVVVLVLRDEIVTASQMKTIQTLCNLKSSTFICKDPFIFTFYLQHAQKSNIKFYTFTRPLPILQ